jgi:hypothetical protein
MSSQEEPLCCNKTLPSKYTIPYYGAKNYKLEIKPLILEEAVISFKKSELPIVIDSITYEYHCTIYWDETSDRVSTIFCTKLEKEVTSLLNGVRTEVCNRPGVIFAGANYPKTTASFATNCTKVEICFPSVDVYTHDNAYIKAILKDYTLPKIKFSG